jgi:alpha-glucoside transport system substrate-binding protein
VYGGADAVVGTNFGDAGTPLFSNPPGCLLLHQGSFMTSFFHGNSGARVGQYDFFPFPAMDPRYGDTLIAAGDLFGMFHDTPQARALISWLASADAQEILVKRGGALSPNLNVTDYPDRISSREGELLRTSKIVRFDASDLMPEAMNEAFWHAMLAFARDPSQLDSILADLDAVQAQAYGTGPAGTGPSDAKPSDSKPSGVKPTGLEPSDSAQP